MTREPDRPPEDVDVDAARASVAARPRAVRWIYGGVGILFVGLGAVGAVLPGLPTTIFLIGAAWCFARSFPELSDRLLDTRLFRPFRAWLVPGGRVSRRSKVVSLLAMWAAITLTVHLLLSGDETRWICGSGMVVLGLVGTWFIVRHGRRSEPVPD